MPRGPLDRSFPPAGEDFAAPFTLVHEQEKFIAPSLIRSHPAAAAREGHGRSFRSWPVLRMLCCAHLTTVLFGDGVLGAPEGVDDRIAGCDSKKSDLLRLVQKGPLRCRSPSDKPAETSRDGEGPVARTEIFYFEFDVLKNAAMTLKKSQ